MIYERDTNLQMFKIVWNRTRVPLLQNTSPCDKIPYAKYLIIQRTFHANTGASFIIPCYAYIAIINPHTYAIIGQSKCFIAVLQDAQLQTVIR